jgi:hypothetical protein
MGNGEDASGTAYGYCPALETSTSVISKEFSPDWGVHDRIVKIPKERRLIPHMEALI